MKNQKTTTKNLNRNYYLSWLIRTIEKKKNYCLNANTIKNQINDFSLKFVSALLITHKTAHLWKQHMKCLMQVLDF